MMFFSLLLCICSVVRLLKLGIIQVEKAFHSHCYILDNQDNDLLA